MGAPSFSAVTGIDTAGRARGSVTYSSSRETAVGINLDSAGLYSEILKRHAATQERPNISILLLPVACGSPSFHEPRPLQFYRRICSVGFKLQFARWNSLGIVALENRHSLCMFDATANIRGIRDKTEAQNIIKEIKQ
jgi:hypothetical protein